MAVIRVILFFAFVLLINKSIIGQNNNPFEIRTHKESKSVNKDESNIDKINSFEIQNSDLNSEIDTANPFEIITNKNKKALNTKEKTTLPKKKSKNSFKIVNKESANGSSGFLFWVFLFILVYIAILLTMNRNLVFKIFKAVWFYNLTNSLLRNFLNRDYLFYLLLSINFILNLATFVYLVFSKFEIYSGFHFWLLLVIAVFVVYFLKHLFIYLFQEVFSSLKSLTLYNFTVLIFNISLGFMLLPLNMIIVYGFDSLSFFLLYFTMGIMGLYLILRLFRGFLITYSYVNISIVHFFLYLCTFEILPLLFFYKLLTINL